MDVIGLVRLGYSFMNVGLGVTVNAGGRAVNNSSIL